MRNKNYEKGFTLIEILIVISIISILFLILIPQVNGYFTKTNETGIRTDFREFQVSSEAYFRETLGTNITINDLNKFMSHSHTISTNGSINQTKSEDPWGNPYEVNFGSKKISFASYGKEENSSFKKYQLFIYFYQGIVDSCTIGFTVGNIELSKVNNLPADFICGNDLLTISLPPTSTLNEPSNFKTTLVEQTKVELSWNSVSGATSYILKRGNSIIHTGSNTTFSDIALNSDTTYTYSVAAKNGTDTSSYATLTVKTNIAPELPPNNPGTATFSQYHYLEDVAYALHTDGSLYVWGRNDYGQIGIGENKNITKPTKFGTSSDWSKLYVSNAGSFGLKNDRTLWNLNDSQIGSSNEWKDASFDFNYHSALKEDGTLWFKRRFNNTDLNQWGSDSNWKEIQSSLEFSVFLHENGTIWALGTDYFSGLGMGSTFKSVDVPTQIGSSSDWKHIYTNERNVFSIKNDGTLWAWGYNNKGQLGTGDKISKLAPTQVGSDNNWLKVFPSEEATMAIKSDGTIWAWGSNGSGELGLGDKIDKFVPTQVGTSSDWKTVAPSGTHTLALKNDGTLWSWGHNYNGQLGYNNRNESLTPKKIGNETDWNTIYSFNGTSGAIKNDGTLWIWGKHYYGDDAKIYSTDLYIPTKVTFQ